MAICSSCGAAVIDKAKFCHKCGSKIELSAEIFCIECGTKNPAECLFCIECGARLVTEAPSAAPSRIESTEDAWGDALVSLNAAEEEAKLALFEYEKRPDGSVVITGLKDKYALTVTLPENTTVIEKSAFEGAELLEIKLPNGLTGIEARAFASCVNLTSIALPTSLLKIGDEAFSGCTNLVVEIPDSVRILGESVLSGTKTEAMEKAAAEAARIEAERLAEERAAAEKERRYMEMVRRATRPGATIPFLVCGEEFSIPWLKKKADEDDNAKFLLACMYMQRIGVEQDYAKSRKLFTELHEKGNAEATAFLGSVSWCVNDKAAAKQYFDLAYSEGSAIAPLLLACYFCSDDKSKNSYFEEAYRRGALNAYISIGSNESPERQLELLDEAIEQGYGDDPYLAGRHARLRFDLKIDDNIENIKKAAFLGDTDSAYCLICTLLGYSLSTSFLYYGRLPGISEDHALGFKLLEEYKRLGWRYADTLLEDLRKSGKYEKLKALI